MTDSKPNEGGSYVMQKDGTLKREEHTAPEKMTDAPASSPRKRAQGKSEE